VKKERSMNVPLLRECGVNIQNECLTHEQYSSSTVKCKNVQFPLDSPIDRLWHPLTAVWSDGPENLVPSDVSEPCARITPT